MASARRKRAQNKKYYSKNVKELKTRAKAASKASYSAEPEKKMAASRASYSADPSKKKAASKASYSTDPSKKKAASRARYFNSPQKKKAAARAYSKRSYTKNPTAKSKQSQAYYAHNTESRCAYRRARYVLAEPKRDVQEQHVKEIQSHLLLNSEARVQLITAFKKRQEIRMPRVLHKAVCRMAARRLLNKSLQTRKEHVGSLLKACRLIKSLQIEGKEDFGEGCHTASTEPYFYDSCYQIVQRDYALPIDENGKCVVAKEVESKTETKHRKHPMKWECSSECKPLTEAEVDTIVSLKAAFENPMQEVRHTLDTCDGCPNQHYTKVVEDSSVDLRGHPLVCSNDGGCDSKLRVLRAAGTHYPVLGNFYRNVNTGLNITVGHRSKSAHAC